MPHPSIEPCPLAERVAQYKYQVIRPFGQAAHQVGIPLRAVRYINTYLVALTYEFFLQVAADTVEHFELDGRFSHPVVTPPLTPPIPYCLVLRRNTRNAPPSN